MINRSKFEDWENPCVLQHRGFQEAGSIGSRPRCIQAVAPRGCLGLFCYASERMKIVLIGATGQLGTDLAKVFRSRGNEVLPLAHSQVDIRDSGKLATLVVDARPDIVGNLPAARFVSRSCSGHRGRVPLPRQTP